jgi:flagellar motor switch protein FliN/FliY
LREFLSFWEKLEFWGEIRLFRWKRKLKASKKKSRGIVMEKEKAKEMKQEGNLNPAPNLDFILDLPLEISVELGRAKILISDLLQLGQGSVIELTKLAGEPLEILINQKLIARGEVVVINEKFGVRLTDIISPAERVKQLGSREV